MAEPKIELFPEPIQRDSVTFQLLAAPKRGGETQAQVSLFLRIKNLEPTDIILKRVGIKIHFSDNSTPFETGNPVSIRIPRGGIGFWNTKVTTALAKDTGLPEDVFINQNIVTSPLAHMIQFKLTFKDFDDQFKKLYALRPHVSPTDEKAYTFPAKSSDLRWDECWNYAAAIHGEALHGVQLFALDLENMGYDPDNPFEGWSLVLPGKAGDENNHYRIWGKPVYAMADGEIKKVRWDFPDNAKPGPRTPEIEQLMEDVGDGGGNNILIETGEEMHSYNHFMFDTIPSAVRNKGHVRKGDFLGKAGNSGNSDRPHLHLGIVKKRPRAFKFDILRPMPLTGAYTINSAHAPGLRRQDPWFRNTAHGLSVAGAWPNTCLIWPSNELPGSPWLFLKEFRCVVESDEGFEDSPYFVIFVGRRFNNSIQSRVIRIRKEAWDETVETGDPVVPVDELVIGQVDENAFVLVALMEEDFDPDLAGQNMTDLRNRMREQFRDLLLDDPDLSNEDLEFLMKPRFIAAINASTSNDECLGVEQLHITTLDGELPLLHFKGDGANYRVRFEMKE